MHRVFPKLSDLRMNDTSNFPFRLESIVHLPLSPARLIVFHEWKEARGKEEAWRLEREGETEMPETGIVADEVEGTYVDLNGEGHQERWQVKNHRSQSDVPGEEGEEMKSQKRKLIQVESEKTQDYVRVV